VKPFGLLAAASPGKDYGASFFDNSSEKRKYYLKNIHSDRGATRGPPIGGKQRREPL
jgi:hypothetical protein